MNTQILNNKRMKKISSYRYALYSIRWVVLQCMNGFCSVFLILRTHVVCTESQYSVHSAFAFPHGRLCRRETRNRRLCALSHSPRVCICVVYAPTPICPCTKQPALEKTWKKKAGHAKPFSPARSMNRRFDSSSVCPTISGSSLSIHVPFFEYIHRSDPNKKTQDDGRETKTKNPAGPGHVTSLVKGAHE